MNITWGTVPGLFGVQAARIHRYQQGRYNLDTVLTADIATIERLVRVWHGPSYGGKKQVAITCS
jgi:hypothetical protein